MSLDCVCKICGTNKARLLLYLHVLVADLVLNVAVLSGNSELLGSFLHSCESQCPMEPLAQQKQ